MGDILCQKQQYYRGGASVIDFLKNDNGGYLYPITLTNAIYDLNGKSLEEILSEKQEAGDYALSSHNHDSVYANYIHSHSDYAAASHTHNYAGSSSAGGSANSAVKLTTARTLTIGSTGKSFDGSANVSWTLAEIGAAATSHTHSYLPLSGGTMTGTIKFTTNYVHVTSAGSGTSGYFKVCTIKNTKTYDNQPLTLIITERGRRTAMKVTIAFVNYNSTDPALNYFFCEGTNYGAYLVKSATSTWDLYVTKAEGYDNLCVADMWRHPAYNTSITWHDNAYVTALPSGYYTAKYPAVYTEESYYQNGIAGRLASITSSAPSLTSANMMLWAY